MNRIFSIILLSIPVFCLAQNSNIVKWERNYENWMTNLTSIQKHSDNSYLIGGSGNGDFSVVKIDSVGDLKWSKYYGGQEQDMLISIQLTNDGYFLAGYTYSYGGDVQSGNHGSSDIWIIKTDFTGEILWEKTYGGKNAEYLNSFEANKNGNFIITGFTKSSDGDIKSGNKGDNDAWVIEIDPSGKIIWEKTFGGSENDIFFTFQQTFDGGYIFGGFSNSKNFDVQSGNKGQGDFWIVKTDNIGNIIWEKTYGGSLWEEIYSISQNKSGEYIVAGRTYSNDQDIKSSNHGDRDIWVIKLDLMGNLIWEQTYGGKRSESLNSILLDEDDKILLFGTTYSNDGDVQSNQTEGKFDWLVEISEDARLINEQTFYSNNNIINDPVEKSFISISHSGSYLLGSGSILRLVGPNTPPKNILLSNYQIYENWAVNISVGLFTVYEDLNEAHTFNLVAGEGDTDNSLFWINGNSLMTDTIFDFEKQSKYTIRVEATDSEGHSYSKPFEIFIKNVNDITLQNVVTKNISCSGNTDGSITYELTNIVYPVSFNWSNGDTTQNLYNVGSGIYTLKIVDGDSMAYVQTFSIDTIPIFPATQICYVTSNVFANSIQIDKGLDNYNVARYCIYREGIYANSYEKIGEISAAESSFVDSLINNRSQSYSYKVSAIDSCGVESALSPAHSTIHLTQNRGISGEVNLYWANYSGIDVSTYSIFRQKENESFELVKQISSNNNTFSDFNVNQAFNYQYYVSFEKEDICYTTLNQKSGEKISVKSNIVSTNKDYTRSEITESLKIRIYPNPANDRLYVETGTDRPTEFILLDITGRQIIHQRLNENKNEINLPKIVDGLYFVKVILNNQIINYQKITKATE